MSLTKPEVYALIDRLADKTLNLDEKYITKILGHPVRIGDVLSRPCDWLKVCQLWDKCGFTKSLQQIVEESGFDTVCKTCYERGITCERGRSFAHPDIEILKSPEARALFDHLAELFPESK